jgi:DNA-directed RNA polymerase I and III subunit RPAC1
VFLAPANRPLAPSPVDVEIAVTSDQFEWLPAGSDLPDETGCRFTEGSSQAALFEGRPAPASVDGSILLAKLRPGQVRGWRPGRERRPRASAAMQAHLSGLPLHVDGQISGLGLYHTLNMFVIPHAVARAPSVNPPAQEIELEAHCIKGVGREHAKWSPVATAWYRLHPEVALLRPVAGEEAAELAEAVPAVFELQVRAHSFVFKSAFGQKGSPQSE